MTIVESITYTLCEGIECNICPFNDFVDDHSGCLLQRRLEEIPFVKLVDKLYTRKETKNEKIHF